MVWLPRKQEKAVFRNPFHELERLQKEMNRIFDLTLPSGIGADTSLWDGLWSPAVDVLDRKNEIVVRAELPGLSKDELDVTIENNVLLISGEKKQELEKNEHDVIRSERYYGSFRRAFTLPTSVDPEKVEAKFDKGVLELKIAKKEEAKTKQIKINVT